MAVPFLWAALPVVASIGIGGYSAYSGGKQAVKDAESASGIEALSMAYQQRSFEKTLEAQKPYMEAGAKAIPRYADAVKGRGRAMEGGLAQMQKGMLEKDTGSMSEHVKNMTMGRLEAEEGEKEKARLMDLQQIGLGYSGSAGKASVNLGGALASSYAATGEAQAGATMGQAAANQNMWTQSLDAISGLPAYYAASQRNNKGSGYNVPSGWGSQDTGTGFRSSWEQ